MDKAEINKMVQQVEDRCGPFCTCGGLRIHGMSHLRRVAILSGRLAVAVGEDVESAVVMGFLHDSARKNDGNDIEHAHDSAILARELLERFYPSLDADRICEAIAGHADGEVISDPLTACLWDADRLELKRIGRTIDLGLLSTETARRLIRISRCRMAGSVTDFRSVRKIKISFDPEDRKHPDDPEKKKS